MGSLDRGDDDDSREVNVFVTGFGPFGENHVNPSYLIASSLPTKHRVPSLPPIHIHTHPEPVTVAYETIRETIPKLLFPTSTKDRQQKLGPNFDMVLHIGMAPGRKHFALETCAHQDGYTREDVYGETLEGDTFWRRKYDAPKTLHPEFVIEDVWRRWKAGLPNEDVRTSTDAGHYLCDFIYYTSLVEYWRRDPSTGARRPVMFLHVPGDVGEEDVERGRKVAVALIAALVGEMNNRRTVAKGCEALRR